MWGEIIVAVCALIGTAITGLGGYKLVLYRLDKVEKKVDKIDQKVDNIDERQSTIEKKSRHPRRKTSAARPEGRKA